MKLWNIFKKDAFGIFLKKMQNVISSKKWFYTKEFDFI